MKDGYLGKVKGYAVIDIEKLVTHLRKSADEFDKIGDSESLRASSGYYGKAEAYREIANMFEKEFI